MEAGTISTFGESGAILGGNVGDRIELPISGYEDKSLSDYNIEEKHSVTSKELFYVMSAGFEHSLGFSYYQFHLSEESGTPKQCGFEPYIFGYEPESEKPHDLGGKYSRIQPEFVIPMAVNNQDKKNNFKPFGEKAVEFHRLSRHHQFWNNVSLNGTYEDYNTAALDSIRSQMEVKGRGYQNGDKERSVEEVRDVILNRNVEERKSRGEYVWNTHPIHKEFMIHMFENMIKIPISNVPKISNIKDFYDFKRGVLEDIEIKKENKEPLNDFEFNVVKSIICFENALNRYEEMGFEF